LVIGQFATSHIDQFELLLDLCASLGYVQSSKTSIVICFFNAAVMAPLFPSYSALCATLSTSTSEKQSPAHAEPPKASLEARTDLFKAWSVVDDAKNKANKLSAEAQKEFDKASAKAQAKTGQIELYSPKFYAACTFGGLLACVSLQKTSEW
jgi:hypothetical protein